MDEEPWVERPLTIFDANDSAIKRAPVSMVSKDADMCNLKDFQTIHLLSNSLYLDCVDNELKLKLLLYTEAYKVKRINAGGL